MAFFRIAFGAMMLWEVGRHFYNDWIFGTYINPPFHFTYHGFEWVRPWPGVGMYLHFLVLGACAALILLGLWYRPAMALFCMGFWWLMLMDKAFYLNHFYLVGVLSFLMIFVPASRVFSLEVRRESSRASSSVPAWSLWLLRAQVAIPYVFGGIVKLNGDWLRGQPMELWMGRMTAIRAWIPAFGEEWLALAFSYAGLLLDLLVVPGLLWRRTRVFAFCAAVAFHLMNAAMFWIGIFPWLMICATTLFLSPDWPRRLLRLRPMKPHNIPPAPSRLTVGWKAALALAGVYFAVQLFLPLRHFLYPGNVDWTEEGARFAWRMMLHEKTAAATFLTVDPRTGERKPLNIGAVLIKRQMDKMASDPEMAREFAAFAKRALAAHGEDVEVRVLLLSSLNGRKPQLLIDPTIDLGAQPRTLAPKSWILPLTEPLPEAPWNHPPEEWDRRLDLPSLIPEQLGRPRSESR